MQIKQRVHLPIKSCDQEGILENTVRFTLIHSHLKEKPRIITCKILLSVARFAANKFAQAHADY